MHHMEETIRERRAVSDLHFLNWFQSCNRKKVTIKQLLDKNCTASSCNIFFHYLSSCNIFFLRNFHFEMQSMCETCVLEYNINAFISKVHWENIYFSTLITLDYIILRKIDLKSLSNQAIPHITAIHLWEQQWILTQGPESSEQGEIYILNHIFPLKVWNLVSDLQTSNRWKIIATWDSKAVHICFHLSSFGAVKC